MNYKIILTFTACILAVMILSNCTEKKCDNKPKYTMAVDSELTLLMRDMFNYYDGIKQNVADGSLNEKIKKFTEIHQATATSPEKSSSPLYQAMATNYIQSVDNLNHPNANRKDAYNLMVDNCMSCHKQMCPGPMVRIKKLYIE